MKKRKYVAEINLKRVGVVAQVWRWIRGDTNRRKIEFGRDYTRLWSGSDDLKKRLLKDIVHEIAHFIVEGRRYRHKYKYIPRHRVHTKRFFNLYNKLVQRLEPHITDLLKLDLSTIQPLPPKPKPTKQEIIQKKLLKTQLKIKRLTTRIKRLNTILKKERRREKYYRKQLLFG